MQKHSRFSASMLARGGDDKTAFMGDSIEKLQVNLPAAFIVVCAPDDATSPKVDHRDMCSYAIAQTHDPPRAHPAV